MAEHRERVDRRMSQEIVRRVLIPLALDLGARYIVRPYLGAYSDEDKTIKWGIGHKRHGDRRHRTSATFTGIVYRDGEKTEGETRSIEVDRRIGWSRKHDNRLVANQEDVNVKIASYNEQYNRIRTFTSLDLIQRFSGSAKGEVLGIGGSVQSSTEAHAHTEVETEKWGRTKQEMVLEDHVRIAYPGPILDADGRVVERPWQYLADRTPGGHAAYHHADNAAWPVGLRGDRAGPGELDRRAPRQPACRTASTGTCSSSRA